MEIVTSAHELGPHLWALLAQANWGRWSWFMLLGTSKNIKQLFKPNAFHQPMIIEGNISWTNALGNFFLPVQYC